MQTMKLLLFSFIPANTIQINLAPADIGPNRLSPRTNRSDIRKPGAVDDHGIPAVIGSPLVSHVCRDSQG